MSRRLESPSCGRACDNQRARPPIRPFQLGPHSENAVPIVAVSLGLPPLGVSARGAPLYGHRGTSVDRTGDRRGGAPRQSVESATARLPAGIFIYIDMDATGPG